jgi:Flp pilus assembly protein TadB
LRGVGAVKQVASRYASLLWLLAALSLVGWLIVNLDTAGWIIISLVVGLMAWQLTRRERRERASRAEAERPKGHGVRDESAP